MPQSFSICLSLWLLKNILIYEKQVIGLGSTSLQCCAPIYSIDISHLLSNPSYRKKKYPHPLGLIATNHIGSTSCRITSGVAAMNNIYQRPEVEARSFWRQKALVLNSESLQQQSLSDMWHKLAHVCVWNSTGEQLLQRLRDNKREIKRWVQHMCEQINC